MKNRGRWGGGGRDVHDTLDRKGEVGVRVKSREEREGGEVEA